MRRQRAHSLDIIMCENETAQLSTLYILIITTNSLSRRPSFFPYGIICCCLCSSDVAAPSEEPAGEEYQDTVDCDDDEEQDCDDDEEQVSLNTFGRTWGPSGRGSSGLSRLSHLARNTQHDAKGTPRKIPIAPGGACCVDKINVLRGHLVPALYTQQEKKKVAAAKRAASKKPASSSSASAPASTSHTCPYNLARVKPLLAVHAFDSQGNPLSHLGCLSAALNLGEWALCSAHREAVKLAATPMRRMPKKEAVLLGVDDSVLVPVEHEHLTQARYLKSLEDGDHVDVPGLAVVGRHGLAGKQSNHALKTTQAYFRTFIIKYRSPTGRTPDAHGRYHGAQ